MGWIYGYFVLLGLAGCACLLFLVAVLRPIHGRSTETAFLLSPATLISLLVVGWIWANRHLTG